MRPNRLSLIASAAGAAALLLGAAGPAGAKARMTGYRVVAAHGTSHAHVDLPDYTGDSTETWHLVKGSASEPNIASYGRLTNAKAYMGEAHFAIAGTLTASAAGSGRSCSISSSTGQDIYDGNEPSEVQIAIGGPGPGAPRAQVAWTVSPMANIDAATDGDQLCPSIQGPPSPSQEDLTTSYSRSIFNKKTLTLTNSGVLNDGNGGVYTWNNSFTLRRVVPHHKKKKRHH